MRIRMLIVLSALCTLTARAIDWEQAEREIERVSPAEFRELPSVIVDELLKRGCTVPQPYARTELANVVRGEFAEAGQSDWAVLCSKGRASSVLIFWGGAARCDAEIARSDDIGWLQDVGAGAGYSRGIAAVGKAFIDLHHAVHGGVTPPLIDHQGIDDIYIEKGSTVRYCHAGNWLELTGSD